MLPCQLFSMLEIGLAAAPSKGDQSMGEPSRKVKGVPCPPGKGLAPTEKKPLLGAGELTPDLAPVWALRAERGPTLRAVPGAMAGC